MRLVSATLILASLVLFAACKKETTTEHGFRFIHHVNKGGTKAVPGDMVRMHFYTYLGDSLMMSSRMRDAKPYEMKLPTTEELTRFGDKFPAPLDALFMMAEGDSATVFEPLDSMVQMSLPEGLRDNKEARHCIMLVDILSKEEVAQMEAEEQAKQAEIMAKAQAAQAAFPAVQAKVSDVAKQYRSGSLNSQLQSTPTGLKMMVVEQGAGEKLKTGETAQIQYYGCLTNGKMFDNSFERGQPLPVSVSGGQMIPGFDEGVALLKHGDKAFLFIPSKLGYGPQGAGETIPPDSDLIFYVEVL
ncbi:MAG: FKBP-type peptidyl-prolyl cis-trans isomerase [Saprospiraceae bacterium]|nr:FKBP-type peptidyl-prolyl cis-trans isomerase [Saprospiraceae bacterium]